MGESDLLKTVGDADLCVWGVGDSDSRIQTRNAQVAKVLAKQKDCRLVGWSVLGGYLRIYAMPYTLAWVVKNVWTKLAQTNKPPNNPRIS